MESVDRKPSPSCKRPYDLGKRLEQMDRTRAAVIASARTQLETGGVREFSMESVAKSAGVTRQTIHNLFGTRTGLLEALFDQIAVDAGMERMRTVMTVSDPHAMLDGFIRLFTQFWRKNRLLLRRIHGIAAIDPEFGKALEARNRRRQMAATRIVEQFQLKLPDAALHEKSESIAILAALTSFEFLDALALASGSIDLAEKQLPGLIRRALSKV